ncbi:MAG: FxLYD domain-containing protein [Candidatus Planktophila sp.]|nr:FxLYD domain-containing protein [Candidatus Planktophila sp.]
MKRLSLIVIFLLISAVSPLQLANAAIKDGSKCSPAGASFKQNGINFICTKISGKVVWKKKSTVPTIKASTGIQSKSFNLESVTFSDDFGLTSASGRVKNTSAKVKNALMTITIFNSDGKSIYTTMVGSAQNVNPGETVTVQFIGTGSLPSGTFKYSFQVDTEF